MVVSNTADNATSTNSRIYINGTGTNSTGNSDIEITSILFDKETDGSYDIDVFLKNKGSKSTTTGERIYLNYYLNNVKIGSSNLDGLNSNETAKGYLNNYNFPATGIHSVSVEVNKVSNEIVTSNNTKTSSTKPLIITCTHSSDVFTCQQSSLSLNHHFKEVRALVPGFIGMGQSEKIPKSILSFRTNFE